MNVKFQDLNPQHDHSFDSDDLKSLASSIKNVISGGVYLKGQNVKDFEYRFGKYITPDQTKQTVSCGNGFDALVISMLALGIKPGNHVLVPYNAPLPVWMAVSQIGAIPYGVEPHPLSYNITAETLDYAYNKIDNDGFNPSAVIVVHMYGFPAYMEDIGMFCDNHHLNLIEDCSHAHGATYNGECVGNFGHIAAFSFYPTKNLGAMGDAGAVHCSSYMVERVKMIREYGMGYTLGINSRMDELQAAVLLNKLDVMEMSNDLRVENAKIYYNLLKNETRIVLPPASLVNHQVFHQFVIRVPAEDRKPLIDHLANNGIETAIHYDPYPFMMSYYSDRFNYWSNITREMARTVLSLPIAPHLGEKEIEYVARQTLGYFKQKKAK